MFSVSSRYTALSDILFLTILISIFYFAYLGAYPLFSPDEGRYGEAAREMAFTGDFVTPRVNGMIFLDKPILYYWQSALAIKMFGTTEWTIRLVPALYGFVGIILTYLCARRMFDRRTGLISALILSTTPIYFGGAHYANLDLEVAVLISATLFFFITAMRETKHLRHIFLLLAYFCSAAAFLTKGMIGIAFPILIISSWIVLLKKWDTIKQLHLVLGFALFLLIVSPWYLLAQRANPDFFQYFFITQQITRFLSTAEFSNKSPIWFYIPVVLLGALPWSLFLFHTIKDNIQQVWRDTKQHKEVLFLLLWIGIIFCFFSMPRSKIVGYLLPIFPALSILIGRYIALHWQKKSLRILFSLCLLTTAIALFLIKVNLNYFHQNTTKPLVQRLKPLLQPEDEIVNYFKFFQDLPVYLGHPVKVVADWQSANIPYRDNWQRELWLGLQFQKNAKWLMDEKTFWQHWNNPKQRLFVFVNKNYRDEFTNKAKHYYLIDQHHETFVFSNQEKPIA